MEENEDSPHFADLHVKNKVKKRKNQQMGKRNICNILCDDLIIEIFGKVVPSSSEALQDLSHLKTTCKQFKLLAEDKLVKRQVFFAEPWSWRSPEDYANFFKQCLDAGNPHTYFLRGVDDYFSYGDFHGGLNYNWKAATAGLDEAKYIVAIILFSVESTRPEGITLLCSIALKGEVMQKLDKRLKSTLQRIWINHRLPLQEESCRHHTCVSWRERQTRQWSENNRDRDEFCSNICMCRDIYKRFCNLLN